MEIKNPFNQNPAKAKGPIKLKTQPKNTGAVSLPITGGRQSEPPVNLLSALTEIFNEVRPEFNLEVIDYIAQLAMYNGDVSYAVNNVQQLGNTPYQIHFGDDVPEELAKEMSLVAKENLEAIYSGGMNSLINDMLAQTAITGALSQEIIVTDNLDDVKEVVQVKTGTIRFMYDKAGSTWMPYQKVGKGALTNAVKGSLIPLNPVTYKYYALTRFGEAPYGIPPLMSALESVLIEREMIKSLKSIVKKLGLFGFMSILVTPPKRNIEQNESEPAYITRCQEYLEMIRPEAEKGFASGLSLGFKETHTFEMKDTTLNVQGARELFNLVSEFKMAGLKQDPLMLGRNFNIAETMAKVILAKLSTQIANYQQLMGVFLADYFRIKLQLRGYVLYLNNMKVVFEKAQVNDKKVEAEAYGQDIDNANALYQGGVINQTQKANYLGYEDPAEDEPLMAAILNPNDPNAEEDAATEDTKTDAKTKKKETKKNSFYLTRDWIADLVIAPNNFGDHHIADITLADGTIIEDVEIHNFSRIVSAVPFNAEDIVAMDVTTVASWEHELSRACPEFPYSTCDHEHGRIFDLSHFAKEDKIIKYLTGYAQSTRKVYKGAINKVINKIAKELAGFTAGVDLQMVQDRTLAVLFKSWSSAFSDPQKRVISKWIEVAYRSYRKDQSVFEGDKAKVPESTFGLRDIRTMDYFKNHDKLYLGKFITDDDTKKKITEFIKEEYLNNGLPIGNNEEVLSKFKEKFNGVLNGEDWKITRVLSTTMNKMRNYAALEYMGQAGVETFEIRGVVDRLQCDYCLAMQGKKFTLSTAMNKLNAVVASSPEYVQTVTPFITQVFKGAEGLEELKGLDSAAIQARNIDLPSYHCNCRDRILADI